MPKQLILLRHAKSDWPDTNIRDFDRPLSKRGINDATCMGKLLHDKGICPNLIISSDATRAFTTATLLAQQFSYPTEQINTNHALYLAPPDTLLDAISNISSNHENVLLVAHNPGITELANHLTEIHIDNLPTCGVFIAKTILPDWNAFRKTTASFVEFLSPKQNLN
ncbi:MAG: histidine phosphatase family protein [Gammaproteobacteria bacterium]|nr:histidine phosphatase family protein [Gammaproteobacteria bacterium]MCP4091148.1 histidine phosphatase family protein [Gammaproteobacteria bacterium]MCP4277326.1 histidine phosphatase family protein [Gammaproteobacteria bacterium]MCP4831613.1 histidine phosphatase family protein [Gammaproteobacteria bacterium]MCP4927836.1 histidine phosphatase family protein [Gammaproteobacteria bacterium]